MTRSPNDGPAGSRACGERSSHWTGDTQLSSVAGAESLLAIGQVRRAESTGESDGPVIEVLDVEVQLIVSARSKSSRKSDWRRRVVWGVADGVGP
jgi:hypothetical protein